VFAEWSQLAAERIYASIAHYQGAQREQLRPLLRRFDSTGSTDDVYFMTRKVVVPATKSPLNYVVLDGVKGNSWEETLAMLLERNPTVAAFAKNDHLGFEIPYVHAGTTHRYVPDFLVRLVPDTDGVERTLIVEVSGGRKSPGPTRTKAETARDQWCVAVNNYEAFGRWGYIEITDMASADSTLVSAIASLYSDGVVTGGTD
jgi:type III restriction enzyme